MGEFVDAVTGFPTVLFTAALVVVALFWLLVLAGAAEADAFDADLDTGALSVGGVPVAVSVSLLTVFGWFTSLTGSVLLAGAEGAWRLLYVPLLPLSLLIAWRLTRAVVRPLVKLFPDEPAPSRQDFIGLTCTIRTGRVGADFGQAEVRARDGSTAVVQVRQNGTGEMSLGATGLLYAYDHTGEFFWVAPY
ncbi:hypothetical protein [Streptomyces sp. NPDC001985]|uniref:hypothetical protein n=1 Tax=Streptomyces sp. NPDC001985 TaxID=3154406 RepID=UPI003319FC86